MIVKDDVSLDQMLVKGDLRMSRLTRSYGSPFVVENFRTKCRNVIAGGLRCEGNADLTGLQADDDVKARHLSVRGNLSLADDGESGTGADIGGDVDLQGASASSLALSAKNFRHPRGTLTLSDTEFRKISIKQASELPARTGLIKFHNAKIDRWEIDEDKPAFHQRTEPVAGGAYVSIEKYFREEGRFHEANRVLVDRVRRSTKMLVSKEWSRARALRGWSLPAPLRWCCAIVTSFVAGVVWLIGEFVGYGTRPWPSLLVIVAIFSWTICTFIDPINVDAGPALRAKFVGADSSEIHPRDSRCQQYCSTDQPCGDICGQWSAGNAIVLAARYNAPLPSSGVDEVWKPSLRVSESMRLISFSNWIFWPLFLASLARYVLRRL